MASENKALDAELPLDFKLELAQKRFEYCTSDVPNVNRDSLKKEILDMIFAHDMTPVYEEVCRELGWEVDGSELERMRTANAKRLQELTEKIKDAMENAGEMEVRDSLHARADYYANIGDRQAAVDAFDETEAKTAGAGPKLDLVFSMLRLDMSRGDWVAVRTGLERAHALCAHGGDWERKNKLRVYEALFLAGTREFRRAAELFLESVATFTATEVMSFPRCVFYTVILAVVAMDRRTLKDQVVDNPEILSVIDSIPHLHRYLDSMYACRYDEFFASFAELTDAVRSDMTLYPHFRYYMREACVVAYSQFLESYKSVTLEAMATAFGVTASFIDAEVADFIVAGRLPAKIDRVAGVVETTRPDAKNALYQGSIRHGDQLLNKLQKVVGSTLAV